VSWLEPHQKIGISVCSPHRKVKTATGEWIIDSVTVDWHRRRTSLGWPTNVVVIELFADGMEIGNARTLAAHRCLDHKPRPEYLLFLDDDVLPDFDAVTKLYAHAQWRPDHDIFAGVYCCKFQNPADPLIYAGDGGGGYWDWAVGDILTTDTHGITSVHMGLTLIRVSLFQKMLDAGVVNDDVPFFRTVEGEKERVNGALRSRQGTEDIWFCQLAHKVGAKILVDTSVLAGHIDKARGITYGLHPDCPPVQRAKWMTRKDGQEAEAEGLKLALDLGAGGTRREWPGHKTYTLDIRPDAKPDYCQDTRALNFPDGHWDLVASSHHLEHLGRWDQERVWGEMARVLKPGGRVEHIVPSLDWAARKVAESEVDAHVLNVLYGAQEAHGYEREFNLHYFGYTKEIARALAEQAGLTDVTCEDWRDHPALGYNLIIKATKPAPVEVAPVEDVPEVELVVEEDGPAVESNGEADLVPGLMEG
jgi:predicted SAM-dependent methyltransferase